MSRIQLAFGGIILAIVAIWLTGDTLLPNASNSRAQAVAFTQITGILSLGLMGIGAFLSARPKWMEPWLDGLDKMYRLHKWLGITAVAIGIVHWLTATGTGHRRRPVEGAVTDSAAQISDAVAQSLPSPLQSLTGLAKGIAEPMLFILIALVAIALISRIPYRIFAKLHLLMVPMVLVLVFHSVVLMKGEYWYNAAGWMVFALSAVAVIGSLVGLANFLGWRNVTRASVIDSHYYGEMRVLETNLEVDERWPGHLAGQFAFVMVDSLEGAHPFTIATNWNPATRKIGFIAKELGDYTAGLVEQFVAGKPVKVQGPYGQFDFNDDKKRQIWIGGGIGITPFVAKMRDLARPHSDITVDLFQSTTQPSDVVLQKMHADAAAAGVGLHLTITPHDPKLDFNAIAKVVPDWKEASVWFCGPAGFGEALKRSFVANGLDKSDFHQELFQMR